MTGAAPLADLAAIFVDRWLMYGGSLVANSETAGLTIGMSMDNWRWRSHYAFQRHWHNGWMTGRWRELQELMEHIPGLREAMVDHVLAHGQPWGAHSTAMVREGLSVGV